MWRVETKNRSWQIHCEATAIIYVLDHECGMMMSWTKIVVVGVTRSGRTLDIL